MHAAPYQVMVVDNSAVIRGLMAKILRSHDNINVVASVQGGKQALAKLKLNPGIEAVVLGIEMPHMDGLTALSLLIDHNPGLKVIMASELTLKQTEISMKALTLGACDYILKPSAKEVAAGKDFRNELTHKIISHIQAKRSAERPKIPQKNPEEPVKNKPEKDKTEKAHGKKQTVSDSLPPKKSKIEKAPRGKQTVSDSLTPKKSKTAKSRTGLRTIPPSFKPEILAIGSSTGGPQALFNIMAEIGNLDLPILITQHMPATFTPIFANHIASVCEYPTREATDGEEIRKGHIYIAPGDYHMLVRKERHRVVIDLNQKPPVNFCRPAVDPMLESIAAVYGSGCLTIILTGMGQDGLKGCEHIVNSGGVVIAQDEETSVVWGMPGSVAANGLPSAILPLQEISGFIRTTCLKSTA